MTASEVFRRTPVRLALVFTALFAVAAAIIFASLYVRLAHSLEGEMRLRVEEAAQAFTVVGRDKGFEDLAGLIESETDSVRDDDTILLLADANGNFRAGNVRHIADKPGWMQLPRASLAFVSDRGRPDDTFLAKWFKVDGGRLLVGVIDREIRQTRQILLDNFIWALLGTVTAAGLTSIFLAWRAQTRIARIATALEDATRGRLDARVPMSGLGDDIDHIGDLINRTLRQLKTLVDNVNQSSSDIAHDLKKPIGRLQQQLDEARRSAREPAEFRTAIDLALRNLDAIVETFEALLNITQIEAGARKSRFNIVGLSAIVIELADVYEAVADDSGQSLTVERRLAEPAHVLGDRELLTQLIANLIENAIQHCPRGARITLGIESVAAGYTVTVGDSGPGIPESERTNVLRRLYRLERSRSTPGSGLGLSFVAAIAELHGARLELSDNAPGLKVSITFPRAET